MKKSKLLIPAVAFLTVSIAAAATSTVAWFTANTRVNGTANSIIAASSDGSLYIDSSYLADQGCGAARDYQADYNTLVSGITTTAEAITISNLRDASFDIATGNASYINKTSTGALDTTYSGATAAKDPSSSYYFYASFKYKFVVKTTDVNQRYDIYLNDTSVLTLGGTYANNIDSALRIGMVTGTKRNVWAPHYNIDTTVVTTNTNTDTAFKYVQNDGSTRGVANYEYATASTGNKLAYKTINNIASFDGVPAYATQSNYLGRISSYDANNFGTLETTFYIWFEGEDYFCANGNLQTTAQTFSLALSFNSIKGLAA